MTELLICRLLLAALAIAFLWQWRRLAALRDAHVAQTAAGAAQAAAHAELVSRHEQIQSAHARTAQQLADAQHQAALAQTEIGLARGRIQELEDTRSARVGELQAEREQLAARLEQQQRENREQAARIAELSTRIETTRTHHDEKLALLQAARDELGERFKTVAGEVLMQNSQRFSQQNRDGLGPLLEPLREQLRDFKTRIEQSISTEGKERVAFTERFSEQLRQLLALNHQLSEDARNLTTALKGNQRVQGHWGELILEQLLENAGLIKGEHFLAQPSYVTTHLGQRQTLRPDIVLNLPEQRSLVIDAKVSVVAYSEFVAAESEAGRRQSLQRHVASIRQHIDGLSGKQYHGIRELGTLDFVLLFVPIEPAFVLALSADPKLWQYAWERQILLVSPSTLLSVTRMLAHLWRQEQQNRNTEAIAERGRLLLDKLNGFTADLQKVGNQLDGARASYDAALKKFSTGNGNLLGQARKLVELGVQPAKPLPEDIEL